MAFAVRRDVFPLAAETNRALTAAAGDVGDRLSLALRATEPEDGIVGPVSVDGGAVQVEGAGAFSISAEIIISVSAAVAGVFGVSLSRTRGAESVVQDAARQAAPIAAGAAEQDFAFTLTLPLAEAEAGDALALAVEWTATAAGALTFDLMGGGVSRLVVRRFDTTDQPGETVEDVFRLARAADFEGDEIIVAQPPGAGTPPVGVLGSVLTDAVRQDAGPLTIPPASVGRAQLAPDAIPAPTGGGTPAAGSIGTAQLADGAVTGRKLAEGAVDDPSKVADGIIIPTKLESPPAGWATDGNTDRVPGSKVARGTRTPGYIPTLASDGELTFEAAPAGGGNGGGVSLAAVRAEIERYTGQGSGMPNGEFGRDRLPVLATGPNRAGAVSAAQAQAVEELANARGAVSMTLQTDATGAIVASTPAPADEVGYSVPRTARRLQPADDDVAAALDRLDGAAPNLTDFQKEVFDHFDRGGWDDWADDEAATQAWVATTTLPTGTAQVNPAIYNYTRSWAVPGARRDNQRAFIRVPKALRAALDAGQLRLVSAAEIDDDHTTYSNIVTSDAWVLINETDPTYDYFYADPVNTGVGENLEVEQLTRFHSTAEIEDGDIPASIARVAAEHAARTAATSQSAIYARLKAILQAGSGVTLTPDDDDSELTVAAEAAGGTASAFAFQSLLDDHEASLTIVSGVQARTNPRTAFAVDLDDYNGGLLFVGASWTLSNGAGSLVAGQVTGNTFAELTVADLKRSTVYNAGASEYGLLAGTTEIADSNGVKKGEVGLYISRTNANALGWTLHYTPQNVGAGRTVAGNTATITGRLTVELLRQGAPQSGGGAYAGPTITEEAGSVGTVYLTPTGGQGSESAGNNTYSGYQTIVSNTEAAAAKVAYTVALNATPNAALDGVASGSDRVYIRFRGIVVRAADSSEDTIFEVKGKYMRNNSGQAPTGSREYGELLTAFVDHAAGDTFRVEASFLIQSNAAAGLGIQFVAADQHITKVVF